MIVLLILVAGVTGVFGLYWLVAFTVRSGQRRRMRRQGRTVPWGKALDQVRRASGFFIIGTSGAHHELLYADGGIPRDAISANEVYRERALLVEGPGGLSTLADLQVLGVADRCVELNLNALDEG